MRATRWRHLLQYRWQDLQAWPWSRTRGLLHRLLRETRKVGSGMREVRCLLERQNPERTSSSCSFLYRPTPARTARVLEKNREVRILTIDKSPASSIYTYCVLATSICMWKRGIDIAGTDWSTTSTHASLPTFCFTGTWSVCLPCPEPKAWCLATSSKEMAMSSSLPERSRFSVWELQLGNHMRKICLTFESCFGLPHSLTVLLVKNGMVSTFFSAPHWWRSRQHK